MREVRGGRVKIRKKFAIYISVESTRDFLAIVKVNERER